MLVARLPEKSSKSQNINHSVCFLYFTTTLSLQALVHTLVPAGTQILSQKIDKQPL